MAIKMICSDIDGTLLQYGRKKLEGEIFDQIRALHDRGILFCPASGRQYTSLRLLFAPVADCCVFLCENGGVLFKDEHCIAENPMPRALAEEIAHDLWNPSEIPEEIVKVSVYLHEGVEKYADRFVPRWQQANCAVAGPYWIDTTTANKGVGVESLCRVLGFAHDEVMAFGDNYNDVAMLDLVGTPYIMDGAAAPLRARYPLHTPRPEDVLREFLRK